LGTFVDFHTAAGDEQPIAHAIGEKELPAEELRHFGTLLSLRRGKTKKSAAVWRKRAMFLALWLF
jgi:hypothetical protein